ncbi:unnamed protein product, partial [Meganyctiphanes norvegica]
QPCVLLNGTCISQDEVCDGRVVINKIFCKSSDSCKCCFSKSCDPTECYPSECRSGALTGRCSRNAIPGWIIVGPEDLQEHCEDGCDCWMNPDPTECYLSECRSGTLTGHCSRIAMPGMIIVGPEDLQDRCDDGCDCW